MSSPSVMRGVKRRGPSSYSDAVSGHGSGKKQRSVGHGGIARACQILLGNGERSSIEFIKVVGFKGKVAELLVPRVEKLLTAIDLIKNNGAEKKDIAAEFVTRLSQVSSQYEKVLSKECEPENADVRVALEEVNKAGDDNLKVIKARNLICRAYIQVLQKIPNCESECATTCYDLLAMLGTISKEQKGKLVETRAHFAARKTLKQNAEAKVKEIDELIEKETQKAVEQSRLFSSMLDALLNPTPMMAELITKRRALQVELREKTKRVNTFGEILGVYNVVSEILTYIQDMLERDAKASLARAKGYRSKLKVTLENGLLEEIPKLSVVIKNYSVFLNEGYQRAAKKERKKLTERNEIKRLYGDSAQLELKDVEQRIMEYGKLKSRSVADFKEMSKQQRVLWNPLLSAWHHSKSTDATQKPFGFIFKKILESYRELAKSLTGPQSPIREEINNVLRSFGDTPPVTETSFVDLTDENAVSSTHVNPVKIKTEIKKEVGIKREPLAKPTVTPKKIEQKGSGCIIS